MDYKLKEDKKMKSVTIFAMNHKTVELNDEAIEMAEISKDSPLSFGTVAHRGCKILIDKVKDKKLKKELENLQKQLKKKYAFDTILAYIYEE